VVAVLLVVIAGAFFLSWKSQQSDTKTAKDEKIIKTAKSASSEPLIAAVPNRLDSPADKIINYYLRGGARQTALSLRQVGGLTEKGVKSLAGFKRLAYLDLGGTDVDNAGVRLLTDLRLKQLNLADNPNVTDL